MGIHLPAETFCVQGLGTIEYYYQPIYNTKTRCVDTAEVLLRLPNSCGGFHDTARIIKQAVENGSIGVLDRYALRNACAVLPEFLAHGITRLSVNFCPTPDCASFPADEIIQILRETGTDPGHIGLEVTETADIAHHGQFQKTIRELYAAGIQISIDDFGSGYAGLRWILDIPFQTLKLDKSLIDCLENNNLAEPLVRCMLSFAQSQGLTVVAEGVETARQAALLLKMGCPCLQGFFFSPPVCKADFFRLLSAFPRRLGAV